MTNKKSCRGGGKKKKDEQKRCERKSGDDSKALAER